MTRTLYESPPPPVRHPQPVRRGGSGLPRRILVAADLTAGDRCAVAMAAALAATTGAELLLGIAAVATHLSGDISMRVTVDWGGRTGGLLHALRVEHPDLVVVPGAGVDPLRRLLSDHHIRRVLHHAAVPVLVVPVQP